MFKVRFKNLKVLGLSYCVKRKAVPLAGGRLFGLLKHLNADLFMTCELREIKVYEEQLERAEIYNIILLGALKYKIRFLDVMGNLKLNRVKFFHSSNI